jgi:hypothetical protein
LFSSLVTCFQEYEGYDDYEDEELEEGEGYEEEEGQEYVVEETWETVVPTSLIALQSSGVAINAEGLPCGEDCIDHASSDLINNNETLGVK